MWFMVKKQILGGDNMTGIDIKIARIQAGLKGYELAARVGITPDVMSRIEVGRLTPEPELMTRIKETLKIE